MTSNLVLLKTTKLFQVDVTANMSSNPIEIISKVLGPLPAIMWGDMAVGNLGVGLACEVSRVVFYHTLMLMPVRQNYMLVIEDKQLNTAAENFRQEGFREAPWSYGSRDDPVSYTDPKVQQSHRRLAQQYSNLDEHSVRFRFPTEDQAKARVILLPSSYAHIAVTPETQHRFINRPQDGPILDQDNILYPDAALLLESFVRTLVKEPRMGGWVSSLRMWAITHLYGDLGLGDDVLDSCDDEEAKAWFNQRIRRYSGGIDRATCTKRLGKVGYDENLARKR